MLLYMSSIAPGGMTHVCDMQCFEELEDCVSTEVFDEPEMLVCCHRDDGMICARCAELHCNGNNNSGCVCFSGCVCYSRFVCYSMCSQHVTAQGWVHVAVHVSVHSSSMIACCCTSSRTIVITHVCDVQKIGNPCARPHSARVCQSCRNLKP
jgi:hypothetical protein